MNTQSLNLQHLQNLLWTPTNKGLLRAVVIMLAVIYILYISANIFWRVVPEPAVPKLPAKFASITSTSTGSSVPQNNINSLITLNIFGQPPVALKTDEKPLDKVPETKLNLTLTGVVASTIEDGGAAIIARNNTQNTYGLGDKIDGTQATLHKVFADRVIISNRGIKETLMLDGVDYAEANKAVQQRQVTRPNTQKPKVGPQLAKQITPTLAPAVIAQKAKELRANPNKFADFLAISPKREGNQLVGYQLSPGKDKTFFTAAGLKPGDVVTNINGLDLSSPRDAIKAMQSLQNAQALDLSLLRQGQALSLSIELP